MKQQEILKSIIPKLREDTSVTAAMLMGSVAAGTEYPTSDLDLYLLGNKNGFQSDLIDDIFVEYYYVTNETAQSRLDKSGSEVYQYLGSKIIYDLDGKLIKLMRSAINKYKNYTTNERDKEDLRHLLYSIRIKIVAAVNNKDYLKADFVTAASSWKCVEAVFAVNNIPLPPTGRVMQELPKLQKIPEKDWFTKLFEKDNLKSTEAIINIIDWALMLL
jgi:predicted nucleotidyltransferase